MVIILRSFFPFVSFAPAGSSSEGTFEDTEGIEGSGGRGSSFMPKGSNAIPVCRDSGLNGRRFDIEPDTSANRSGPAGRSNLSESARSSILVIVEFSFGCADFLRADKEILLARFRRVRGDEEYSLLVMSFSTAVVGVVGVTGDLNTGISVNEVKV